MNLRIFLLNRFLPFDPIWLDESKHLSVQLDSLWNFIEKFTFTKLQDKTKRNKTKKAPLILRYWLCLQVLIQNVGGPSKEVHPTQLCCKKNFIYNGLGQKTCKIESFKHGNTSKNSSSLVRSRVSCAKNDPFIGSWQPWNATKI